METFEGSAKRSVNLRRKLAEQKPELLENKKGTLSLKDLGGDVICATPKKVRKIRKVDDFSSDEDSVCSQIDLEGIEQIETKKKKILRRNQMKSVQLLVRKMPTTIKISKLAAWLH